MVNSMWLTLSETTMIEYKQSLEEGRMVEPYKDEAIMIRSLFEKGVLMEKEAAALLEKMKNAPVRADYGYVEPSDYQGILDECPEVERTPVKICRESLKDKIYGAWLARCVGCLFGQPVEGWYRDRIVGLFKDTGNYPPKGYMSSAIDKKIRERYHVVDEGRVYGSNHINWINNVSFMPEDDDTNYTVLCLKTVEEFGRNFTAEQMAHSWMMNLQFLHACTAERVAYRNFTNRIEPPYSALYNNCYREWIGAQIRADLFGYINPGNPREAARMAYNDASISHVKNGIYGEMFVAAMLAKAAVSDDVKEIIDAGLAEIPKSSRLREAIDRVFSWYYDEKISSEEAQNRIHELYDEKDNHDWCHTISNAMICTIALLWGELDLEKTIGIAVTSGFDTDCNGATTASIVGMVLGASSLPEKWVSPLNDTIISGIDGFGRVAISSLAERTLNLIEEGK